MSELYKKLAQAQSEFDDVKFDKTNPHFKSKYATLAAIKDAIEPALHRHGFAIVQPWECMDNGDVKLTTKLLHESGEEITLASSIIKGGRPDQQMGSSFTYQRRYQISSALFLFAEEDDDGELTEGREAPPQPIVKAPKKPIAVPPANPELLSTEQVKTIKQLTKDKPGLYEEIKEFAGKDLVSNIEASKYEVIMKIIKAYNPTIHNEEQTA